jgi:hypothetical protein
MDTLIFWMFAGDAELQAVDFGACPRRSSDDVPFRVKNDSTSYVAEQVTVSVTGAQAWNYLLSLDADHFAATVELGDLPPSGYSDGIYLRRVTPSDAPLGEQAVDVIAQPAAWSQPQSPLADADQSDADQPDQPVVIEAPDLAATDTGDGSVSDPQPVDNAIDDDGLTPLDPPTPEFDL